MCGPLVIDNMNKLIFSMALLFFGSILNSCAAQVHLNTSIRTAKKSFVKVETYIAECDEERGACMFPRLFASGSGSVVRYRNGKAILTAAHVCYLGEIEKELKKTGGGVLLKIQDRIGRKSTVHVIKYNIHHDVCLLGMDDLDLPALRLSVKEPVYAERMYNISAPMGISNEEMVPVFEGLFMGNDKNRAHYGIPTIGGASGSPILNSRGELVGMIHSVHFRFHHLTLSVTYKNLWNFLKDNQDDIDTYVKRSASNAIDWSTPDVEPLPLEMYFLKYLEDFEKE